MTPVTSMTAPYVVCPYRFSADPPAMIAFLELLGLRLAVSTADRSFGILSGRGGRVAVHSAASSAVAVPAGRTSLSLEVADAASTYDGLLGAGLDAVVWDEAYGKQVGVRDPHGQGIWVNERMRDLYGYLAHEESAPSPVEVAAVYYTADFDAAAAFFGSLGLRGTADLAGWRPLRGGEGSGVIGLHDGVPQPGPRSAADPVSPSALVELSFWTTEPLAELTARLRAAGHPVRVDDDCAAPHHTVTDPDGRELEVHQAG